MARECPVRDCRIIGPHVHQSNVGPLTIDTRGRCRYCGEPRPDGYSVTCGRSDCQEAAYHDKERRAPRRAR